MHVTKPLTGLGEPATQAIIQGGHASLDSPSYISLDNFLLTISKHNLNYMLDWFSLMGFWGRRHFWLVFFYWGSLANWVKNGWLSFDILLSMMIGMGMISESHLNLWQGNIPDRETLFPSNCLVVGHFKSGINNFCKMFLMLPIKIKIKVLNQALGQFFLNHVARGTFFNWLSPRLLIP